MDVTVERWVRGGGGRALYRAVDGEGRVHALECAEVDGGVQSRAEECEDEVRRLHRLAVQAPAIVAPSCGGAVIAPSRALCAWVMRPWIAGESLAREVARSGGRAALEALALLAPVARALDVLHLDRRAHLALCPRAILLSHATHATHASEVNESVARAHLVDCALGRWVDRPFDVAYAAPEQLDPTIGPRGAPTDVYALALVFLEVVSGRAVFGEVSPMHLYERVVDRVRRPSLRDVGLAAPPAVDAVLQRALSIDVGVRFAHAGALWGALTDAVRASPPVAPIVVRDAMPRRHEPATASAVPPARASSRARIVAGAAAIAVGFGAFFLQTAIRDRMASSTDTHAAAAIDPSRAVANGGPSAPSVSGVPAATGFPEALPRDEMVAVPQDAPRFFVDRTEVTVASYARCVAAAKCTPTRKHGVGWDAHDDVRREYLCNLYRDGYAQHPVNCVSLRQASAFCGWVEKRLPTGAEWSEAAGAHRFPWGDGVPRCARAVFARYGSEQGGCSRGRVGTDPVGTHPEGANALGVVDLAGNVWEWTTDRASGLGVLRGGGWDSGAVGVTIGARLEQHPDNADVNLGFRCVRDAP